MINPSTGKEFEKIKFEDVTWGDRAKMLGEFAKELLEEGYKIIIVKSDNYYGEGGVVFFNFTKDEKWFGYAEQTRNNFSALTIASVHQGSKAHGTGTQTYNSYDKPTRKDADEALLLSQKDARRRNLKPTDSLTFKILNYMEVIE